MCIDAKPLLVLYREKDETILYQLKKLVDTKDDDVENEKVVGTEDGSVSIVAWSEKVWLDNKRSIKGAASNAVIERSNDMGSVDVSNNFKKNYSMKYYATGVDSAKQQATNVIQAYHKYLKRSKTATPMTFEEYIAKNGYPNEMQELLKSVYYGQGRVIPIEQLQDSITF